MIETCCLNNVENILQFYFDKLCHQKLISYHKHKGFEKKSIVILQYKFTSSLIKIPFTKSSRF